MGLPSAFGQLLAGGPVRVSHFSSAPGPGGTINPSYARSNPQGAAADLTRAQWAQFTSQYRPLENRLLQRITSPANREANASAAGSLAGAAYAPALGDFRQRLANRGLSPTPGQLNAQKRLMGLSRAKSVATATNVTRRAGAARDLNSLASMAALGSGVANSASAGLNDAANAASARKNANRAADQAKQQQDTSTTLSIAAMTAAYFL